MLKIIKSGFGGSGERHIKEMIRSCVSQKQKCYLIVPEQQTVMAEGEMAKLLPADSPLYFEATNFTRLANTVFRKLGGLAGEYCDSGRQALIMWRTLTELSPVLDMTKNGGITSGLVEQALNAVKEMESLAITPEMLADSIEGIKSQKLLSKINDLSRIMTLYKLILKEKYSDSSEAFDVMQEKLKENEAFLSDTAIYILGFTSFTEGQYRLIGEMAKRTHVCIHLPISKTLSDNFEYKEILNAERKLKAIAKQKSADIQVTYEDGNFTTSSELLATIPNILWQINPKIDNNCLQNEDELRIFEAPSPFDACDFIGADIRRRVMNGAKYSDFAIIARSADKYASLLENSLKLSYVPVFTSVKQDITSFEAVKFILTAFSIVCRGYRREDVITYAKCGYSGIPRDRLDELELYSEIWQINGSRWTDGQLWNMNPDGYSSKISENAKEKLLRINETKEKLIEPLLVFSEDIKNAPTVRDAAEALTVFLVKVRLESSIKQKSEELKAMGEATQADELLGLWKLIINSLDAMVEVLGDLKCDPEAFLSQLKTVLSFGDLGKIPAYIDQVTVGSADMLRLSGKSHVYMIGVNKGEFPASVSESSFFSEYDREVLSSLGLAIEPEIEIKNARELFCFSRAMGSASKSVTLIYSTSDTKFKRIERSEVIDKIISMTNGKITPKHISEMKAEEKLFSPLTALNALDTLGKEEYSSVKATLQDCGFSEQVKISESSIKNTSLNLSGALIGELYKDKISLTQSRLDSYVNCPMSYLLRYTLKLGTVREAKFDAASIGSFIHGCLEYFFSTLAKANKDAAKLSFDERVTLVRKSATNYVEKMGESVQDKRTEIKIERITKAAVPIVDSLCNELASSPFRPTFFELKIEPNSSENPSPPILKTEDGTDVYLYGIIDRVDTLKDDKNVYVKVIDYKTGAKDFSPDDLEKGRNLQTFVYIKALMESKNQEFRKKLGVKDDGEIIPSGVIYIKTSLADVKIDKSSDEVAYSEVMKNQKREGMALNDEFNIEALGKEYLPGAEKRNPKRFLYTREEFDELMKTVEGSVIGIAEKIKQGKAEALPDVDKNNSPCNYCDYKYICRNVQAKK